ncbi:MAG: UDP-N-acetylglucosamine 2-epimerase (non-hydrolyzing) [Desulforegulaceae bacterium]|nr:UDP-N-acetylglucosamine 2-epimerase (non-hydrolyzing) [Desulforegulaceae bacterium]
MKRIVTIVGARPQFVKAAVISRLVKKEYSDKFEEIIVHTGQHYNENMSDVFFKEMMIPKPDINLNIGSGTHGKMTGRMLEKIEEVLLDKKPDLLLVYGDTNSTLAGALAASKLHIPVAHVEAGLRSFNMKMPEEQNRILTDHISSFLFCPTETAVKNLDKEGITKNVFNTGDVMYDASLFYEKFACPPKNVEIPDDFALITLHRAENTDSYENLRNIVEALNESAVNAVMPLHPRTKKMLEQFDLKFNENIRLIEPVGFFNMIYLEKKCRMVITDSGGVQKEAYFFKKPCITLREQTEWVETVEARWNELVGSDKKKIIDMVTNWNSVGECSQPYGNGKATVSILNCLL